GDDAPIAPARLSKRFTILPASWAAMDTALDAIRKVAGQGRQLLKIEMRDATIRQTWAKMSVRHPQRPEHHSFLPVTVDFEVAWPFWEDAADRSYLGIHAGTLGSGNLTNANATTRAFAGSPDTFTITYSGTKACSWGYIEILDAVTNPKLTNLTNGYWWQWTGALVAGDRLFIYLGTARALKNGVPATYAFTKAADQVPLMLLEIGANSMKLEGAGPDCTFIYYWSKWYA
ncbi:MAG: phage tail family protein, partial [Gammaproteobacteria bacterium]|nr:phage tail family protein [Gammaproteobacteria bacterium]